jgi:hypothetical protein
VDCGESLEGKSGQPAYEILTEALVASVESTATRMRRSILCLQLRNAIGFQPLRVFAPKLLFSATGTPSIEFAQASVWKEKQRSKKRGEHLGRPRAGREPGEAPSECGIFRPNEAFPAVSSSKIPISASCRQPGGRMANNSLIQMVGVHWPPFQLNLTMGKTRDHAGGILDRQSQKATSTFGTTLNCPIDGQSFLLKLTVG